MNAVSHLNMCSNMDLLLMAVIAAMVAATAVQAAGSRPAAMQGERPGGAPVCMVTAYGAMGDNRTEDTVAIQSALDSPSCPTVLFPAPGKYLARPLHIRRSYLTVCHRPRTDGRSSLMLNAGSPYKRLRRNNRFPGRVTRFHRPTEYLAPE